MAVGTAAPAGGSWYLAAKRALDVTCALAVLLGLAPLWLLIAVAIRLTSRGPALFQNTVVGQGGRPFTYYKFRTMHIGRDDSHHRRFLEDYVRGDRPYTHDVDPATGRERPVYKVINDPRVTALGRWLRKWSLDEVPQFINVLRGDMSVVGPRPPLTHEHALYDDATRQRLAVKPGITGLAQVSARGTASFSQMVALDLEYVRRRSFGFDLAIMARTIPVMLLGRGYTG